MAPLTTGYAGHADIDSENVAAILNQFLPEDPPKGAGLGLVLIPERVPRLQKGLKTTIAWLEGEVGEEGTIPVEDLIKAMLERKEAEGDDLELYLLFDPDNEDDVALAAAADEAGIPVRNLAAAGDYIVFEDATDTAEPEGPPFDVDEAQAVTAEAAAELVQSVPEIAHTIAPAGAPAITFTLTPEPGFIQALADAIVLAMSNIGAQSLAAVQDGPVASVVPIKAEDKPAEPAGRTEQEPGTSAFYYNSEKGTYRKARGMTRPGEEKVYLTEDEAAEARTKGVLA